MEKKADKIIILNSELSNNILPEYSSKLEEWQMEKLLGKSIDQIRKIRDQIKNRVKRLIREIEKIEKAPR
ncbi:MAG: hypothetical protein AOA65_0063 [Candidatus Bathyarchaeota archaeon BA1]|nr:MAG: hypothetical protein AOA65_0063 [Candidatus Bathyarchaeota archaeon BA1]